MSLITTILDALWPYLRLQFLGILAGSAFTSLWAAMGRVVVCWLNMWLCSVLRLVLENIVPILKPVFETIPQTAAFDMAPMIQWYLLMNYYLPVAEAFALLGVTYSFVMSFRLFRFIKQFVPAASN